MGAENHADKMDDELFADLPVSVEEMVAVEKGGAKPAAVREYECPITRELQSV